MLSEPMNYDLPLSSKGPEMSVVEIPDCGNSFSEPTTMLPSKENTIHGSFLLQQREGTAQCSETQNDSKQDKLMKQLKLQKMQQSLYVSLNYREIEGDNEDKSSNNRTTELDGRFGTGTME